MICVDWLIRVIWGSNLKREGALPLLLLAGALAVGTRAEALSIPNASFELPAIDFVSTLIDDWQKAPRPDWYEEGGGFTWDQLTGVFRNPIPSSPSHIENCDGDQALWLFAVPEVGLFQDLREVRYEPANAYRLTVGVIGGGGNMLEGVTLEAALYYRDDSSNQVTIATSTITNSPGAFPTLTHFIDFAVELDAVKAEDPWAGRSIGVRFLSTVALDRQGGYWDLDHVRLEMLGPPRMTGVEVTAGEFQLTVESRPGTVLEILASGDPALPLEQWTSLSRLTNDTGRVTYSESVTHSGRRFYQARQE